MQFFPPVINRGRKDTGDGMRIAVLGAGKIGRALIGGILRRGVAPPDHIVAVTGHPGTLREVVRKFQIRGAADGAEACRQSDVILLCVKPQVVKEVVEKIRSIVRPGQLVLSTVTGVPIRFFEETFAKGVAVVRTMPNTPCLVGAGMTALCAGRSVRAKDRRVTERIFGALGRCLFLDEKHLNAATGLSGSGPAFLSIVIEALAEGGVKVGLPRDAAMLLAAQTMAGTAKMVLETGKHPALLKEEVTTPAGCTIDGILALEEGGLRVTLIKAVTAAAKRAAELFESGPGPEVAGLRAD